MVERFVSLVFFALGIWLLVSVDWKICAGVFLFVWGNNLSRSMDLKDREEEQKIYE